MQNRPGRTAQQLVPNWQMKRILGCAAAQVNETDSGWKKRAFAFSMELSQC
jgi:hypothetical protein